MICKYCGSNKMVKDGVVAGKQRYKCKECHKTMRKGANGDNVDNDDKRDKYPLWQKISAIRAYIKGNNLNETARISMTSPTLVRNWIKNYETNIKKELTTTHFPENPKDVRIIKQKYLKLLRDERKFDVAFGIILTDKGPIVFIMDTE